MMVNATYVHVHACVILGMWRPAGRKTRVDTLRNDNCGSGEAIANFSNEASDANGLQKGSGPPACGGAQENIPCRAACASQRRQSSLFAMTQVWW